MHIPAAEHVDSSSCANDVAQLQADLLRVPSLAEAAAIVVRAARRLGASDGATFVLRDGQQCHYLEEDTTEPLWKGQRFPMSICISGWTMSNRKAAVVGDALQDPRIPYNIYRFTYVRSLVMMPVGHVSPPAAIGLYWRVAGDPPEAVVARLQHVADVVAVTMGRLT
jgi:two-component system, chemotaxis family, CheB/CheR fusion protein